MPEHKDITDPNIHEVKGASTASAGQVLTANGDGTTSFAALPSFSLVEIGSYRIVNSGSAQNYGVADTFIQLQNNSLGAGTSSTYGVVGVTDVWNESTNYFDFSGFDLGDLVLIDVLAEVNPTGALESEVKFELEFGVTGSTYRIPLFNPYIMKLGTTYTLQGQRIVSLRDSNTRDLPARIISAIDAVPASVLIKEINLSVFKRG